MKIKYLNCNGEKVLFSFHRHDYQDWTNSNNEYFSCDGGFSVDPNSYIRMSSNGNIEEDEISNLIQDIREQFTWGKNYDKDNNKLPKTKYILLKDLETGHIFGILKYFTEKLDLDQKDRYENEYASVYIEWKIIHLIFIEELIYREKNNLLWK